MRLNAIVDFMERPSLPYYRQRGRTFYVSLYRMGWYWTLGLSLFFHLAQHLILIKTHRRDTPNSWLSTQKASHSGQNTSSASKKWCLHGQKVPSLPSVGVYLLNSMVIKICTQLAVNIIRSLIFP